MIVKLILNQKRFVSGGDTFALYESNYTLHKLQSSWHQAFDNCLRYRILHQPQLFCFVYRNVAQNYLNERLK